MPGAVPGWSKSWLRCLALCFSQANSVLCALKCEMKINGLGSQGCYVNSVCHKKGGKAPPSTSYFSFQSNCLKNSHGPLKWKCVSFGLCVRGSVLKTDCKENGDVHFLELLLVTVACWRDSRGYIESSDWAVCLESSKEPKESTGAK